MRHTFDAGRGSGRRDDRGSGARPAPQAAPDALVLGILWGLLFALLGFWLPLGVLVSRGLEAI